MVTTSHVDIDKALGNPVMQLMNSCTPNYFFPPPTPARNPLPHAFVSGRSNGEARALPEPYPGHYSWGGGWPPTGGPTGPPTVARLPN
jgi:hypothetical protein